jgi:acyl-CoA synthetase (AMP-forming)/AMP-acid ligase II
MTSRLGESDYRTAGPRRPGGLASWPSDAPTGCAASQSLKGPEHLGDSTASARSRLIRIGPPPPVGAGSGSDRASRGEERRLGCVACRAWGNPDSGRAVGLRAPSQHLLLRIRLGARSAVALAGGFHPDATAEAVHADGLFRTGDIGRVDEDGYYYTVGRKKDLIIHGGYNVYPREMEEVLYEHPAGRSGCDRFTARRAG